MAVSLSSVIAARTAGFRTVTDVTCSEKYVEGGESLTAANLGLATVDYAICQLKNGSEGEDFIAAAYYDPAKALLHLIDAKTGKEVAKEVNASKVVVRVIAHGKARAK